ncbi:MAG TPA: hypothetical protein VFV27_03375 [Nevskiaceae bacterium]|nr:hypothetical protein [Nevskiaceae bacterium]
MFRSSSTALLGAGLLSLLASGPLAAQTTQDTGTFRAIGTQSELRLIDPANPDASPLVVDRGRFNTGLPALGLADGTLGRRGAFTDLHIAALPYVKAGRLSWVSLLKSQTPRPRRFTSEAEACAIEQTFPDFRALANSGVVYFTRGADGRCLTDDDAYRFARLGSRTDVAGRTLGNTQEIVGPVYNLRTGAIDGYVFRDGVQVHRTDASLNVLTPVMTLANLQQELLSTYNPATGGFYFITRRAGDAGNERVLRYSGSGSPVVVHRFASPSTGAFAVSARSLVFIDGDTLQVLDHSASSARQLVRQAAIASNGATLTLSRNAALVGALDFTTFQTSLTAYALVDGAATPLLPPTTGSFLGGVFALGDRVHFNVLDNRGRSSARLVRDNGTLPRSFANASWLPGQIPTSGSLSAEDDGLTALVLTERLAGSPASARVSLSRGAGTYGPESIGIVDNLPSGGAPLVLLGIGRYLLGLTPSLRTDGRNDQDVLYADTQTPGTLRRIQVVEGSNEVPLSY